MSGTDNILSTFDVVRYSVCPDMQCMPANTLIRQYYALQPGKIHDEFIEICPDK